MPASTPLFVLSCERSGSTLLRYILDTHPEICCPGELAIGRLVRTLRHTVTRTLALTACDDGPGRDRAAQNEVRGIVDSLLCRFAAERGKQIWCDKTPDNLLHLDHIDWAFPNARYLCLYRQGKDVIQSCLESSRDGFMTELASYVQKRPDNLVAAMLENWIDKTERLIAFEAGNERCLRLRYEDLVTDSVATLNSVFGFLELSWDPSLLDEVFATPHDPGGGDANIRSSDRINQDRIGRGIALNPIRLAQAPPNLHRRMAECYQELLYAL
jgi:hypothetical protein